MKLAWIMILGLVLLGSPVWASWQQDWEIDQAAGIANRPWQIQLPRSPSEGQNTPLMRSGLPPYDQQPEGAQNVPEPVIEEIQTPTPQAPTPSTPSPNDPTGTNPSPNDPPSGSNNQP